MTDTDRPETLVFLDDGRFPNSVLPVLHYRAALGSAASVDSIKARFSDNDWPPQWVDTVMDCDHYHSTAHEVLGVAKGHARIVLGGPAGRAVDVERGDVVVIPAGVSHRLDHSSDDFAVVGAYPPGQEWDLLKGEPGDREKAIANIGEVPLPETDPVMGGDGPLTKLWQ